MCPSVYLHWFRLSRNELEDKQQIRTVRIEVIPVDHVVKGGKDEGVEPGIAISCRLRIMAC